MAKEIRFRSDDQLDMDINQIMESFRRRGYKNVSKPDVVRLLIDNYKRSRNKKIFL